VYTRVEAATVLAQQVEMMDKSFTFRTWNLNKMNLPMFRSTEPSDEDVDFDGCCMSLGNPTNVKMTYYEAFAGE